MKSFLQNTTFRIAFGAWWFSWIELQAIVSTRFGLPFSVAIIDSAVSNLLIAGCCLLLAFNMQYYLPRKERYWYILVVSLVTGAICYFLSRLILQNLLSSNPGFTDFFHNSALIRFSFAFLQLACMAMISMVWNAQKEQEIMMQRKNEAEKMAKDSELFRLRQQLQPHFLFNSLNSISALTGSQPQKAREMIQQLSDFLRGTLKKDESECATLEEELQNLELYLEIEKVRFGYRLKTNIESDDSVLKMKVPPLLLQPVVENAIKFGLYDTIGEVCISVVARSSEKELTITVNNPYDPETAAPANGTGFGLNFIKRRLFLLYGRDDLMDCRLQDNIFSITITIPQINEGHYN